VTPRGWRIDRVPAKPVRIAEDGRISVPLWLLSDGVYHSDVDLRLSSAEAEALHAQLTVALGATSNGWRRTDDGRQVTDNGWRMTGDG
jgi:hypothetical protein